MPQRFAIEAQALTAPRPLVLNSGTKVTRQQAINFEDGLDAVANPTSSRVDVGLAAAGHGADKHTDIQRSLFIPGRALHPEAAVEDSNVPLASRWGGLQFQDSGVQEIAGCLVPPILDYASGNLTLKLWWSRDGAEASASVIWGYIYSDIADGAAADVSDSSGTTTVATPPAQRVLMATTLSTSLSYTVGQAIGLRISRESQTDAFTGAVILFCVEITYTATQ